MTDATLGADAPAARSAASKLYFLAWRWHFYAGLYVIPFVLLLAVTGTMMVWFSAIAPEYGERLRIAAGDPLPVQAQAEAALAPYPGGTVTQYIAPWGPENPALFRVAPAEGAARMLAVNPQDGTILRDMEHGATWEEWADHLHGELMQTGAAKAWGDFFIEVAASLALLLVATGLYMAWPRGRGLRAMLVPDLAASGRPFWKSLHGVLGTWLSLVLVFFLISGLSWAGIWGGKFVQAWSTFPAEKWDNVPLSDATHAGMNHTAAEEVPWALEQTPMPESGSDAGVTGVPQGQPVTLETVAALARTLGFDGRFQLAVPADELRGLDDQPRQHELGQHRPDQRPHRACRPVLGPHPGRCRLCRLQRLRQGDGGGHPAAHGPDGHLERGAEHRALPAADHPGAQFRGAVVEAAARRSGAAWPPRRAPTRCPMPRARS
jgi:uncharacterized iron-regulated membrane protein